jgi:hypothetical protein
MLLMSRLLKNRRSLGLSLTKSHNGGRPVVNQIRAPFLNPFFRQNPLFTG